MISTPANHSRECIHIPPHIKPARKDIRYAPSRQQMHNRNYTAIYNNIQLRCKNIQKINVNIRPRNHHHGTPCLSVLFSPPAKLDQHKRFSTINIKITQHDYLKLLRNSSRDARFGHHQRAPAVTLCSDLGATRCQTTPGTFEDACQR